MYDPFSQGPLAIAARTIYAEDKARRRVFPVEIWRPAAHPETCPLIVYSHHSGGSRRSATFLCAHLASHGYIVAALDHSETVAKELARRDGLTAEERAAVAKAIVAARVPDIRFLLDQMLGAASGGEPPVDAGRIGIVGHSIGGWTALAAPEVEPRIRAVVALAPGGASNPRPGILRANLTFAWGREVPTLYLVAENDVPLPLAGMYELFQRTPEPKKMFILRRADHLHFIDNVEQQHEAVRNTPLSGAEWDWMIQEMLPISELCSGEQAHAFLRALTLAHMDAALLDRQEARAFLSSGVETELAHRGISAMAAG